MIFSIPSPFIIPAALKCIIACNQIKSFFMSYSRFHVYMLYIYSSDSCYSTCKKLINNIFAYSKCLKNLSSLIALHCGNAHFRHNFYNSFCNCFYIPVTSFLWFIVYIIVIIHILKSFINKIRIYSIYAISNKYGKMVYFPWLSCFKYNAYFHSCSFSY